MAHPAPITRRQRHRTVAGGLAWLWPTLRANISLLFFLQNIGTNLALATLFGRSLIGDGEALITQLARAVHHGEISERKRRYTRKATLAWTLFFLITALISTLLWLFASQSAWSVFANLLSMPLLAAMFVAEHVWRVHSLPPKNGRASFRLPAPISCTASRSPQSIRHENRTAALPWRS